VQIALATLSVSQFVMISTTSTSPLYLHDQGHPVGIIGLAVSLHLAGMYVASPLSGWLADRFGRLPVIAAGALMLIFAVGLAGIAPGTEAVPVILALFLNGVGWNLAFVAGSALLTDALAPVERASVQGLADLLMGLMGAIGSAAGGMILGLWGFAILNAVGAVAGAGPARGHLAAPARARLRLEPRLMLRLLPDLRYLGAGTLLNSVGMMGEVVVLGWLALELTDSPFLVGAAMGARALPLFFVGVPAGVIADRLPRHPPAHRHRRGPGARDRADGCAGADRHGEPRPARPVDLRGRHPARPRARGAAELRPRRGGRRRSGERPRHPGRGHARGLAGGLARRGRHHCALRLGPRYLFVAAAYLAGGLTMLPARAVTPAAPSGSGSDSIWRGITSFVDAVNRDRMLLVLMMLTGGAEVLGFAHQALLPSLARDVLHTGPEGLGMLNAARAVGGILAMLASMRGFTAGSGALFVAVLVSFGGSLIALGVAPYVVGFIGVALLVLLANAAGALADLLAQSLLQLRVPAHLRGARRRRVGGGHRPGPARPDPDRRARLALRSQRGPGRERPRPRALAGATALLYPRLRAL